MRCRNADPARPGSKAKQEVNMYQTKPSASMQHESPRAVDVCVLIPAYRPGASLIDVVKGLTRHARYETVVVVDDGSGREYASIFEAISRLPQVHVITKALNRGKGAALRIG